MGKSMTISEVIRFLRSKNYLTGMSEVKEVPVKSISGDSPAGVLRTDFQNNDLCAVFVANDDRKIAGWLSEVLEGLEDENLVVCDFGICLHFRYDTDLTFGGTLSINVLRNRPSYNILSRQHHFAVVCRNKGLAFTEHPNLLRPLPAKTSTESSGWSACRRD